VDFLAYQNTIEERILSRMGRKMKAAQTLYGKEAAGVLVEADDDDIQRQLIREALQGKAAANAGEMVERCSLSPLHIFASGDERPVMVKAKHT
jgi:hypothetical protein